MGVFNRTTWLLFTCNQDSVVNSEATPERRPTVTFALLTGLGQTFLRRPYKPAAKNSHFSLSQGQTRSPRPPVLKSSRLLALSSSGKAPALDLERYQHSRSQFSGMRSRTRMKRGVHINLTWRLQSRPKAQRSAPRMEDSTRAAGERTLGSSELQEQHAQSRTG